ncbi:MAG TPA: TonB-dependent receptor [Acidisarcina sp.]
MPTKRLPRAFVLLPITLTVIFLTGIHALAQTAPRHTAPGGTGTAGMISGTVTDSSGAIIPGANIEIHNALTGFHQTQTTDAGGQFRFTNLAFGNYHLSVVEPGFQPIKDDVPVQSVVAVTRNYPMQVSTTSTTVTVEADSNDVVEGDPSAHTDIDRSLVDRLPLLSSESGVSAAITLASPGVTADSNGMFHPLGEHADTSYSIDGQPISDQQSKTFSNQISMNAVQSLQVIEGVIPPEYGDKASLVARTTTRSGLGTPRPSGDISFSYGSFGSTVAGGSLAFGSAKFGNFITLDGANSGRFLDAPERQILHGHGNNESVFDRGDYAPGADNTLHLNLTLSRSWFQVPNQYDQQSLGQDQRSQIFNFNVAPFWTHLFSETSLISVNPYLRQDNVHYYPSDDPFSDTPATLAQDRQLRNLGLKVDYSFVKGIHNLKAGADINHTFLKEGFAVGLTSPTYNAVCVDANGNPVVAAGITDPAQCSTQGYSANPGFQAGLLPFDLSRGGSDFRFSGRTDVKEESVYFQDNITLKSWQFLAGLRGDNYNGLSSRVMIQPRAGITYNLNRTGSVLRVGYSRLMPTPYNENLILSSSTGSGGLATDLGAAAAKPLSPAARNQYEAGFEQTISKHLVVDGEYFWKETKDDFDFDVLLNTPLTFPIQWRKSKIDGFDMRVTMPALHGVSAYSVIGHTRARFFGPEQGGILFNNPNGITNYAPFRIDHDQAFQQTSHLQFQPRPEHGWYGFTWSYESGLVAGNAPFAADPSTPVNLGYLSGDQQAQIELSCGGVRATLSAPLTTCAPSQLFSPLVSIPAPGTENDDRNPPRVAPRSIFDMAAGWDNLFHRDRYKTNVSMTVSNLTNKVALYNFLSTFSGTHFVPPRAYTAQMTFNF